MSLLGEENEKIGIWASSNLTNYVDQKMIPVNDWIEVKIHMGSSHLFSRPLCYYILIIAKSLKSRWKNTSQVLFVIVFNLMILNMTK